MPHTTSTTPSIGSAHPRESALIIVDLANDFVHAGGTIADAGGPDYQSRAATVIPPLQRLLAAARESGVTVIYSTDAHTPTDSELRKWPPHSMAGTHNAQIVDGLTPQPGDVVLGKTTYSQFQTNGEIDRVLQSRGIRTVYIRFTHGLLRAPHVGRCVSARLRARVGDRCAAGVHAGAARGGARILQDVVRDRCRSAVPHRGRDRGGVEIGSDERGAPRARRGRPVGDRATPISRAHARGTYPCR